MVTDILGYQIRNFDQQDGVRDPELRSQTRSHAVDLPNRSQFLEVGLAFDSNTTMDCDPERDCIRGR